MVSKNAFENTVKQSSKQYIPQTTRYGFGRTCVSS